MRVVLLNQYYAPDEAATAQLLADVGAGLVEAGHEVDAICCRRGYADPDRRYPGSEVINGVRVRRVWSTGFGRESKLGRVFDYASFMMAAAARLAFSRRPDVVISLSTPPMIAAVGWATARLRGAKTIYWVMDVYPELAYELGVLRRGSMGGRLLKRLSAFLVRRSDQVVVLGETMAGRVPSTDRSRLVVIHNWADGEAIRRKPPAESRLREAWGWNDRFVALYSGNMGLAHEFETILQAAALLRDRREILFAFVGGGPRRREVEARTRELELTNVEFRPYVARSELGESLTAADVHLVTLRPGVQGLLVPSKIYGILAAGVPTVYVGPGDGEIDAILSEGGCGTRIDTGRPEELVAALCAYMEDSERRLAEGRGARALFDEHFERRLGVGRFVSLVERLSA